MVLNNKSFLVDGNIRLLNVVFCFKKNHFAIAFVEKKTAVASSIFLIAVNIIDDFFSL
jgi:hypothetical protein